MRSNASKLASLVTSLAVLSGIACSGSDSNPGPNPSGGAAGAGGTPGNGGTANVGGFTTGGLSQVGGATASGGTNSAGGVIGIGGIAATGGAAVAAGGTPATGGAAATGGSKATGGAEAAGGTTSAGGSLTTGGTKASGGNAATGGTTATGGTKSTGGTTSTGGTAVTGGTKATGGTAATGGTKATGGTTTAGSCGVKNANPFACKFAWGAPSSGTNYSYLNFVSTWVGDETNGGLSSWSATANNNSCGDCNLVGTVAGTSSMVVFYTYFIGFQACKQGGYCDCNTSSPPNLCSNGAQWIRNNRAQLINAYGQYAKAVYARSPNKPVIWWLEGDFPQYNATSQSTPLSPTELGQLARDITCAIKSNEPNAIVAMNHAPWTADAVSTAFWAAQPVDVLDLIWVQGAGDAAALPNSGSYNATTANYAWLHNSTGLKIMAETSYAGSGANDRWSTTTAANINARIANGVIGVLVNSPPSNYQTAFAALNPSLSSTCN